MPKFMGFHHIALTVIDADKSEEFYTKAFKFLRVLEIPDQEGRGLKRIFAHPSGMILGFSIHASNDGASFSEFRTGLDHFAFTVESRDALDEWAEHLDGVGIEHSEIRDTGVGYLMTVRDPDNIQVELWANPT